MANVSDLPPSDSYIAKAQDFFQSMKFLGDDPVSYGASVALLAVHASISLVDAILLANHQNRSRSEDHKEAVRLLKRICRSRNIDQDGVRRFSWLIERKNRIAYEHHRLDINKDIKFAQMHAERFFAWALHSFNLPQAG